MEILNRMRKSVARHILMLSALMAIMLLCGVSDSSCVSGKPADVSENDYITVTVRTAKLVFVGSVVRLLPSDCIPGLLQSYQGIVFQVRGLLKGSVDLKGEITAYYNVSGKGPLEVVVDNCDQLDPDLFRTGREFIVACNRNTGTESRDRWKISEGPWLADRDVEKMVIKAIAKGNVGLAEEAWLRKETDLERFIQGKGVPDEKVLRAIRTLGELAGSQSSQEGMGVESLSRSALQTDLDRWREWYEEYHQCLVWDKAEYNLYTDKKCMKREH